MQHGEWHGEGHGACSEASTSCTEPCWAEAWCASGRACHEELVAAIGGRACVYCMSLRVHESNQRLVADPFKKMSFDSELCYTMGCDYYFFNIELKELEGFSLNYQ